MTPAAAIKKLRLLVEGDFITSTALCIVLGWSEERLDRILAGGALAEDERWRVLELVRSYENAVRLASFQNIADRIRAQTDDGSLQL